MKLYRLLFHRELATPVLALMLASGVCLALLFARVMLTGGLGYRFLALIYCWHGSRCFLRC